MLPEGVRELLTAYVDGELSARRRRHVLRLLRHSPEARRLLQRLQTDSRELQELPYPRLDRDLSGDVLQKVASRPRKSARPPVVRRVPAAYPAWMGVAAAAAVLFLIGGASYCYFAAFLNRPAGPAVALHQNQDNRPPVAPEKKGPVVPPTVAVRPPPHNAGEKHDPDPAPHVPVEDIAHHTPANPTPPVVEKDDPVLTSEGMEMFVEIKSVATNLDVPATFKLHDLEQEPVRKKLVAELQKDAAVRAELPVRAGAEAFKRLQTVLKAHHADLTIDASAARRIARPLLHTNYVLYSEDLTAEELAQVLRQLGVEAKKDKRPAADPFDRLVVRRMTERDHKELAGLLGVDPVQTPPKGKGPLGVDPRKPVADGTAAQVAAALAAPRPEPGKSAGKQGVNHPVLVLPFNPVRPRRDSAEIKRFLEARKPMRSGALHVLLVLRGPTG